MKRRKFIQSAGYSAAASVIPPMISEQERRKKSAASPAPIPAPGIASVSVKENKVYVETSTLTAVLEKGVLTSLKSKLTGEEFIEKPDTTTFRALQLLYIKNEVVQVNEEKFGSINARQVAPDRAEIVFQGWDGDGVIFISADSETGDMVIEPSAYSSRPGVLACRWNITGLKQDLELVAPLYQGIKMKLDDVLIKGSRWRWPYAWEAGFAIIQSKESGFWVHTRDTQYKWKALQTGTESDPFSIGFDSENSGPVDNTLSAGGVSWRLNMFKGDWKVPAESYRQWLWKAYNLEAEEKRRQPWIHDIKLALSWCPGRIDILEALATKISPNKVLLHYSNWRTDRYDQNYPTFIASDEAKAFINKCHEMGFHVAPHSNAIDMDPSHPAYTRIRDFQYRSIESKQLQGWSSYQGKGIGVPESNQSRNFNRDKNVMVKIHPGLSMWRSILGEEIQKAVDANNLEAIFIDVTLCIWNLHNGIVESMTPPEGMNHLIRHVARLGKGLVVGGEGLDEITTQGLSFAQAHLFRSNSQSIEGLERAGGCALNEFLFGRLCRTIGYSGLGGRNENEELRMKIHVEHGAVPTITIRSANDILNPNAGVKKMLDLATS